VLGEGIDIFAEGIPASLAGKSLGESQIGAKTALNVIAVRGEEQSITSPGQDVELPEGGELVMVGTAAQRQRFRELG
jgi:K+/H+ antiporter YhaU regulatory subunit KhtT